MRVTRSATGGPKAAQRREYALAFVEVGAGPGRDDGEEWRSVRAGHGSGINNQLVREPCQHEFAVETQYLPRAREWVKQHPGDHRADRMKPIGDGGNDAKVAAAALQRPEQVRMRVGARRDQLTVCGDDVV